MMARPNVNKLWTIRILLATVVMTTATAMAQQPVSGVCRNGRCSDGAGPGAATGNDYSRRATQSSREWSDVAADDSMLSRTFRPVSSDRSLDFPDPADRLSGRGSNLNSPLGSVRTGRGMDWRSQEELSYRDPLNEYRRDPRDEFGLNSSDAGDVLDEIPRNRRPLDSRRSRRSESIDRTETSNGDRFDDGRFNDGRFNDSRLRLTDGRDPFVPAPLPRGRRDEEAQAIDEMISARYMNPVNVRAVRAMSADQAVRLFAEVSEKIDGRHLEPSTYDLRVRRALRNLTVALDNDTFIGALGISGDSFRTDGFRDALGRLADSMQVRDYQDAQTVMTTVMKQAAAVPGLTASVVGFEFASASMDTLDKFSGLEPAEPGTLRGAARETGVRSASLEEEIVGVGVEVKVHAEGLLVVKALRGGPAAEAGIQSGDVIIAIDRRTLEGMPMAASIDLMKGTAGSPMNVRIYRDGKGERDFSLTRRKVRVWTVNDTRLLDGSDIGYLSLSRFAQNSTAELDQALSELYKQGMKSLVIDLRGNPGGLLTTCVEISDRFLPCGTIVSTKGRLSSDNMLEEAHWEQTWSQPLVVLIDGDSASASEIFAAAVQENRRGVVVGTRSYGKGTVQTHFPLNTIGGNLRLTTAKFYSPNGRPMAGEGVTPDVTVNDADGVENGDEVLEAAIRIARSRELQEMAKAAGTCRKNGSSAARSSSLNNINDPIHSITTVQ